MQTSVTIHVFQGERKMVQTQVGMAVAPVRRRESRPQPDSLIG
jgi:hypothetical protein